MLKVKIKINKAIFNIMESALEQISNLALI